jgi:hypothetical protein
MESSLNYPTKKLGKNKNTTITRIASYSLEMYLFCSHHASLYPALSEIFNPAFHPVRLQLTAKQWL